MPDPVIVDDGGSTRIRANRLMDGFFDPTSGHSHDIPTTFTSVSIVYQDADGEFSQPSTYQLTGIVEITSEYGQKVTLDPSNRGHLKVQLSGNQYAPQVVRKQRGNKPYYQVENAGPIQTVTMKDGATTNKIYDASGPGIATPVNYTSVVLKQ